MAGRRKAVVRTPALYVPPFEIAVSEQTVQELEQLGEQLKRIRESGIPQAARQMRKAFDDYLRGSNR
jgi:hypothetical protein